MGTSRACEVRGRDDATLVASPHSAVSGGSSNFRAANRSLCQGHAKWCEPGRFPICGSGGEWYDAELCRFSGSRQSPDGSLAAITVVSLSLGRFHCGAGSIAGPVPLRGRFHCGAGSIAGPVPLRGRFHCGAGLFVRADVHSACEIGCPAQAAQSSRGRRSGTARAPHVKRSWDSSSLSNSAAHSRASCIFPSRSAKAFARLG
jgi:hypothetical protein